MFAKRILTTAAILVLAMTASQVHAQTNRPAANGPIDVIGQIVITCVRPSTLSAPPGKEPTVTSYQFTISATNRVDLSVNMRWYGWFTENEYRSRFTIKIQKHATGVGVLGIDYTDNCLIPAPDVRLLNSAIPVLNDMLNGRK